MCVCVVVVVVVVYRFILYWRSSQVAPMVKNLPANAGDAGDRGSVPGWKDPLEQEMATHSSILVWEIP